MSDSARAEAERWLAGEPDADIRAELEALIAGPADELARRFDGRLQFGTAGLRAAVGAGPQRMNRLVVRQAAAGLAKYLLDIDPRAARAGRDHRLRRPPQERRVRARHRVRDGRVRYPGDVVRPVRSDARGGVVDHRGRRRRRRRRHRLPQPAGRQRLQGVPRRRCADRAAARRRHLGMHRRGRSGGRRPRPAGSSAHRVGRVAIRSIPTSQRPPASASVPRCPA